MSALCVMYMFTWSRDVQASSQLSHDKIESRRCRDLCSDGRIHGLYACSTNSSYFVLMIYATTSQLLYLRYLNIIWMAILCMLYFVIIIITLSIMYCSVYYNRDVVRHTNVVQIRTFKF